MTELTTSQANRLGDRLRNEVTPQDLALLQAYRETYGEGLEAVVLEVRQVAASLQVAATIGTRPAKTTRSIVRKLVRERTRLSRMQEIAGCRIVVQLPPDQDALVAALAARHQEWRVYDLRQEPRYGYRAVHLVTQPPRPVELQVRTFVQQVWADTSERLDRIHEGIKYGTGPARLLKQLQTWSDRLAEFERSGALTPTLILDRDAVVPIVVGMLKEP